MNAVIYCRVSSKEQVNGTSLESQELACKEYAARHQLTIVRTFVERGESAKYADRPQLLELLAFCAKRENAIRQVLVWKVDRLARNVGDHFTIKAGLLKHDTRVVSVTEPIEANPEGKLMETILAGFAQFDNDIRAARSTQGMRRKIEEGIFPWKPPLGYKSDHPSKTKKTVPDIPDQPRFGIIKAGLEEFATGTLTKAELHSLLNKRGLRTRSGNLIARQTIDYMLADSFYAGILRNPWNGVDYPGRHLAMISPETFQTIQRIIAGRSHSVPHRAMRDEFPLRTFARCGNCEQPLTGSFSRGRSARYPYYHCIRRDCDIHERYPLARVHGEFAAFLARLSTTEHSYQHLKETIRKIGAEWDGNRLATRQSREAEIARIQEQSRQLVRMKVENLVTDEEYTSHRAKLYGRLAELEAGGEPAVGKIEAALADVDALRDALGDLSSVWQELPIEKRKRFQFIALPSGYIVGRIGTAQRGLLFSLLGGKQPGFAIDVPSACESWHQLATEVHVFATLVEEGSR